MVSDELRRLAAAHGVATTWKDQLDRNIEVNEASVRGVLLALGVDPDTATPAELSASQQQYSRPDADKSARSPHGPRGWGWQVQLYALRSSQSWGIGDLADLKTLLRWTAGHGGDVVLVNPMHAVAPIEPMQPSPYFPASRRWLNPIYLRVEDVPEYAVAEATIRRRIDALRPSNDGDRIDRDETWRAKRAALELLFDPASTPEPTDDLAEFGLWCALVERHGGDWREWPDELSRPDAPGVEAAKAELAGRIRWHAWLQQRTDEQCREAQTIAREAGMSIGVMHDLAVGTDPGGADAWAMQDVLATNARIGAPPDEFNQQGQDWGMPPWHPTALAELDYEPLRAMVRAQLRRGGGLRIDHVLGLFRLWWIPEAATTAADGAYVSYDAGAMLGVIVEEALRAEAVIVGEDLGVVPKQARAMLAEKGILGTSLLLFEREDAAAGTAGALRPLGEWREAAMASVSTHDLPTVLGWLRGEHVRVRAELGLLRDVETEWRDWLAERAELVIGLAGAGLLATPVQLDEADVEEPAELDIARAMHRALPHTPSRWVLASPSDAVGCLRQPNLPGTVDEYPNWRLAVTDAEDRPLLLEELLADRRVTQLAADLAVRSAATER